MAKKETKAPTTIIYTNENCGYCTTMKEKFNEKGVKFVEKERSEYLNEWREVNKLTGLMSFPTLEFNGDYYVPGRDFQSPDQIVDYIKDWDPNSLPKQANDILLEAFKTLTFTFGTALNRLQQELQQIKQQLDEHKSND